MSQFVIEGEHARLQRMVGEWEGLSRLWLDPNAPPEEARIEMVVHSRLDGRFVEMRYHSTAMGKTHEGQFLLGWHKDLRRFESAWIDGFHNGTAIMFSVGEPGASAIEVLGSYPAGGEQWGWRTHFRMEGDELLIESVNIWPSGQEDRATEMRLRRRAGR